MMFFSIQFLLCSSASKRDASFSKRSPHLPSNSVKSHNHQIFEFSWKNENHMPHLPSSSDIDLIIPESRHLLESTDNGIQTIKKKAHIIEKPESKFLNNDNEIPQLETIQILEENEEKDIPKELLLDDDDQNEELGWLDSESQWDTSDQFHISPDVESPLISDVVDERIQDNGHDLSNSSDNILKVDPLSNNLENGHINMILQINHHHPDIVDSNIEVDKKGGWLEEFQDENQDNFNIKEADVIINSKGLVVKEQHKHKCEELFYEHYFPQDHWRDWENQTCIDYMINPSLCLWYIQSSPYKGSKYPHRPPCCSCLQCNDAQGLHCPETFKCVKGQCRLECSETKEFGRVSTNCFFKSKNQKRMVCLEDGYCDTDCSKNEVCPFSCPDGERMILKAGMCCGNKCEKIAEPCCKEYTSKCQSCMNQMTEEEYCKKYPKLKGCDEIVNIISISNSCTNIPCGRSCYSEKRLFKIGICSSYGQCIPRQLGSSELPAEITCALPQCENVECPKINCKEKEVAVLVGCCLKCQSECSRQSCPHVMCPPHTKIVTKQRGRTACCNEICVPEKTEKCRSHIDLLYNTDVGLYCNCIISIHACDRKRDKDGNLITDELIEKLNVNDLPDCDKSKRGLPSCNDFSVLPHYDFRADENALCMNVKVDFGTKKKCINLKQRYGPTRSFVVPELKHSIDIITLFSIHGSIQLLDIPKIFIHAFVSTVNITWVTEDNTYLLGLSDYKNQTTIAVTIDIANPEAPKLNELVTRRLQDRYLTFDLQESINFKIKEQLGQDAAQFHIIRVKEPVYQTADIVELADKTAPYRMGRQYYMQLSHWIELIQFFVIVTTTVLVVIVMLLAGCYFFSRHRNKRSNKVVDSSVATAEMPNIEEGLLL